MIVANECTGYRPLNYEFIQHIVTELLKQIILIPSIKIFIHNAIQNETQEQIQIMKQHKKDIQLTNKFKMYDSNYL
jgi:hypothetical protein